MSGEREGSSGAEAPPTLHDAIPPVVNPDEVPIFRRGLSIGATGRGRNQRAYHLIAVIARGGMGELFLADLVEPDGRRQRVVVKRLLEELGDDADYVEMFRFEAETMTRLDHANIVRIIDAPVVEGQRCLAMEYVRGRAVSAVIERTRAIGRHLPPQVVLHVMVRVLAGLDHVHNARLEDGTPLELVHRDVTPGNLLVGFDGQVKLTDFGIAKSQKSAVMTTAGIVKGKARYLAPEQIIGERATPRSDLFSSACVLVEMFSTLPIYERQTVPKTLYAIVNNEREPVATMLPFKAPKLTAVIERALSVDPKARQGSATELAAELLEAGLELGRHAEPADIAAFMRGMFEGVEEPWEAAEREIDLAAQRERAAAAVEASKALVREETLRLSEGDPLPKMPAPTGDNPLLTDTEDEITQAGVMPASLEAPPPRKGSIPPPLPLLGDRPQGPLTPPFNMAIDYEASTNIASAASLPLASSSKVISLTLGKLGAADPAEGDTDGSGLRAKKLDLHEVRPESALIPIPRLKIRVGFGPLLGAVFTLGTLTGIGVTMMLRSGNAPPAPVAVAKAPPKKSPGLIGKRHDTQVEKARAKIPAPPPPEPAVPTATIAEVHVTPEPTPPRPERSPTSTAAISAAAARLFDAPPPDARGAVIDLLLPPTSKVKLDGNFIKKLPARGLGLVPGRHQLLVVVGSGKKSTVRRMVIDVSAGERVTVDPKLTPRVSRR